MREILIKDIRTIGMPRYLTIKYWIIGTPDPNYYQHECQQCGKITHQLFYDGMNCCKACLKTDVNRYNGYNERY